MAGRKFLKLFVSLMAIVSLLLSAVFSVHLTSANNLENFNINRKEVERNKINEKKKDLQKSLKETKNKIEDKRKQCDAVNKQIMAVQDQIAKIKVQIDNLIKEISEKNNIISEKQLAIQENMNILMRRLVAVYKAGEVHILDLLLNAKTFDDLIDTAEIISKMSEHDGKLLNELKADIQIVEDEKKAIEIRKAEVEVQKDSLVSRQEDLQNLLEENEKLIKSLESEQSETQADFDETNAEYLRIQNEITEYYARKAREEEERRLRQQKNSSNGNNDSTKFIEPSGKNWLWPVPGYYKRLSSRYMEKRGTVYHKGIDIAGAGIYGKPVIAVDDGIVFSTYTGCRHDYGKLRSCGCGGGYGNYVMIIHANGKLSIYGHLSRVCVYKGQKVSRGQKIGEVGTTGHSTGPHLHFQTKINGVNYNPLSEYN